MLQVRKNEISLRQWPAGTALLRTLEGTLIAKYALCWQQCFFSHSIEVRGFAISSHSLHIMVMVYGNGLLFHMTQPISRSTIKTIACSKPTISEH